MPLQTKQKAIVEVGRIVHAILVEDECVRQGANFQEPMPVGIVSGEAGYLQAHNDPCASHANIGHQVLEAFAPRRGRAGFALIAVDDDDLIVAPPEADGTAAKAILALGALDVFDDLSH